MHAASEISFEKGRQHKEAGAKLGRSDRVQPRQNEGDIFMDRHAIAAAGTKLDAPLNSVPDFSETTAKERFSAVIIDLKRNHQMSRKEIGRIAGVGSETVKAWERGRQIAQAEHIFRLGRSLRSVRRYALRELGAPEIPDFMSPRVTTAMMAAAYQVMHQDTPDGDELRQAMTKEMANAYRGMNIP